MICQKCGSVLIKNGTAASVCPECSAETVRQLRADGPICPRCSATMVRDLEGKHYCYPCSQNAPRPNMGPLLPTEADIRKLQERIAKLESGLLDLRRRLETDEERRLRKIREALAEQGLLPNSAADAVKAHRFLGPEGNEEPSPEEPGETR